MYMNSLDRVCLGDFLLEEDWEQLAMDGLIADVDKLVQVLEKSIREE